MKILTVDDKVENLYLLESMLNGADCGYQVSSALNGVEALEKLEQEKFDLIISDILMPRMDGFELCHQVKKRETLRNIPFIFYTATYTEKKDEELGLRLGASRFIIKPVEPDKFLAILREVIREFEAGGLTSPPGPEETEAVLLKAYNGRLVQKLDRKVQQLEQVTRQLQAALEQKDLEVAGRRKAEDGIRRLNAELEERVRQRTGELAAANEDLRAFAYAVSHDLRAPLRAIACFNEILATSSQDKLDEEERALLNKVRTAVERMDQLIDGLLQLSHASRGELRREAVNLSQMAREIEGELRREEPGRRVNFSFAPNLVAEGDPVLLRSVLRNLLGNAWKFTANSPEARIQFGQTEQDGEPAYFVSDNGAGFDMENAAKLFAPFQRLHPAAEFPGTGIGLTTVQQIIRRHGGKIWAKSAADKGATFYFTLQ